MTYDSKIVEVNFDGLVGPSHNFSALSFGNLACQNNGGAYSSPRDAALEGLQKMRTLMRLGIPQGVLPPPPRPAVKQLRAFGFSGSDADVLQSCAEEDFELFIRACSASSMWAANAATVLAPPDTRDGRTHFVTANLSTMLHRAFESVETWDLLCRIFNNERYFAVHPPAPHGRHCGDEGAANHMRLAGRHDAIGVNIFVNGESGPTGFPARQALRASQRAARLAGLDRTRTIHAPQNALAINAGAFHNDVVAVANENVLLTHAAAFADQEALCHRIRDALAGATIIALDDVTLEEAVASYLFNSQLITRADGSMLLVAPGEIKEVPRVFSAVERILAGDNPINEVLVVDVRGSMRNGGGPACLRLRVPLSRTAFDALDPRFLLTERRCDELMSVVDRYWPKRISPPDLFDPHAWDDFNGATDTLWRALMATAVDPDGNRR